MGRFFLSEKTVKLYAELLALAALSPSSSILVVVAAAFVALSPHFAAVDSDVVYAAASTGSASKALVEVPPILVK